MTYGMDMRRALILSASFVSVIVLFLLLWKAAQLLLLLLAGILLCLAFLSLRNSIRRKTGLSEGKALAVAVALIAAVFVVLSLFLAPRIAVQTSQLVGELPRSLEHLQARVMQYEWIRFFLQNVQWGDELAQLQSEWLQRISNYLVSVMSAVFGFVVILFVGLYLAAQPALYREGLLSLLPDGWQGKTRDVLSRLEKALQGWMVARMLSMLFVGVVVYVGLALLDMPLALTFSILAGLGDFVPNFGPIITAVPALLIASMQDPVHMLYIAGLYIAVQAAEGYIVNPLLMQHTVRIPPVVLILSQILGGMLFGVLGLILAAPMVVIVLVVIRTVYLQTDTNDGLS